MPMLGGPLGLSYVLFSNQEFSAMGYMEIGANSYSLAPLLKSSAGGVYKALKPLANAYAHITGYRQHGLRYDDLIIEEREDVQKVGCRTRNYGFEFGRSNTHR